MDAISLELTVIITSLDGKALPEQGRLIEQFMDYVYDYYNEAGAYVQSVQVTAVDGDQVS